MALKEIHWTEVVKLASPYPYALAVTLDEEGTPNIIGLGWWSFVSWQPPMLMISVGFARYSFECLEINDDFTLCFPSKDQAKQAWLCGKKSGREIDKFAETGFKKIPGKKVTTPIIHGCTAAIECRVNNKIDAGDHRIYIADILALYGDKSRKSHIYTIGYSEMIGFGTDLKIVKDLGE